MKKTAIYMRVSSVTQAKEGESLEYQRKRLIEYIQNHPDLVLVDEYMDDGVSGTKFAARDELQRMLSDVAAGKIDIILFTKLDRFFRSVRHLMNTLDTLDRYGVEWNAIEEHHDNTTPTGKLALTIMGAFAEMEANMGSIRVKDAFHNKISKGEWLNNRPPFGYMIVDKKAVPNPETKDLAIQIFEEYRKTGKLTQLVKNHIGDPCPNTNKSMKYMLRNRAYIGEVHGIPNFIEPIISQKLFDDVQRLLAINIKHSVKHEYIFSGLVICPECGKKMDAQTNKIYARYICGHRKYGTCTYGKLVSEAKLETYLIERYREDLEKRYIKLKKTKKVDNSQKINSIYRKMDRLKDLYVNELIDLKEYKEDLERYRTELNALERPQETNTAHIEELLKLNVYEIYHTLNKAQKRRLWRTVIKSITPENGSFKVEYL